MRADDVVNQKSTISFPRELPLDESEELLQYLAKELSTVIRYQSSSYGTMFPNERHLTIIREKTGISGTISRRDVFDDFELLQGEQNLASLRAMKFNTLPGLRLTDYRLRVRRLWDETRRAIDKYFEKSS